METSISRIEAPEERRGSGKQRRPLGSQKNRWGNEDGAPDRKTRAGNAKMAAGKERQPLGTLKNRPGYQNSRPDGEKQRRERKNGVGLRSTDEHGRATTDMDAKPAVHAGRP